MAARASSSSSTTPSPTSSPTSGLLHLAAAYLVIFSSPAEGAAPHGHHGRTGATAPPVQETCAGWPLPGKTTSFAGAGRWQHVGNHRVEVRVTEMPAGGGYAVRVVVPWARHDADVANKAIVVLSAETAFVVANCSTLSATDEVGDLLFSASEGPGLYHVYYAPYANGKYARDQQLIACSDDPAAWLPNSGAADERAIAAVPNATVERLQSRTSFDAFGEMELAATAAQVAALVSQAAAEDGVLLVTEDRTRPVRMVRHLPRQWATTRTLRSLSRFDAVATPGEHLHFQVALFASASDISIVAARFSDELLPVAPLCMNLEGSDYYGRPYAPSEAARAVAQGTVRSFYVAAVVPSDAAGFTYEGTVTLVSATGAHYTATVQITVAESPALENGGDDQIWRNTRLQWLNSKLGLGDHKLPTPFTPVTIGAGAGAGRLTARSGWVSMLGKRVTVGDDGLLFEVDVSSDPAHVDEITKPLAAPMRFEVSRKGKLVSLPVLSEAKLVADAFNRTVSWSSYMASQPAEHAAADDDDGDNNDASGLSLQVSATLDFSGYVDYVLTLNSSYAMDGLAVSLVLPMAPSNSHFALGLGRAGGLLSTWFNGTNGTTAGGECSGPGAGCASMVSERGCLRTSQCKWVATNNTAEWRWDGGNGNNALWLGSSRAGLRVFPKGESDEWQAAVPFDDKLTPPTPESWSNNGTGGIRVLPNGTASVFTGERSLVAGESLVFRFSIMVTPTRPLNLTKHWGERHYQAYGPTNYTAVAEGGATILVEHQGNVINPWINYPYATNQLMAHASKLSHAAGLKFKIYNTMRELSYKAKEIWAMRSLEETYVIVTQDEPTT